MRLIASTVAHNGKINGIIVAITDEEYSYYMQNPDLINENTISATFLKEYIEQKGIPYDVALARFENAYTVSIPVLKDIFHAVDENLDYHVFLDAYCEYLKSL